MYYGWLDEEIWALKKSNWRFFHELPWCLVTCIDSSDKVKYILKEKKVIELESFCSFLGNGLIVREGRILDVAREYNLFHGFDEIWFYQDCPTIEKPEGISIVMPSPDLSKETPSKELQEWFNATKCILGLGDGVGMNYITTSEEIVQSLYNHQRNFDFEKEYKIYETGCLKISIFYLIQSHREIFEEFPFVLITRIDNAEDVKSISEVKKVVESEAACSFVGNSLLVSNGKFLEVIEKYNLLNSIKEIWLYDDRPAMDKPSEISIVSPIDLSKESVSNELIEWFFDTECVLGMDNNVGMNYITTSKEVSQFLYHCQKKFDSELEDRK